MNHRIRTKFVNNIETRIFGKNIEQRAEKGGKKK